MTEERTYPPHAQRLLTERAELYRKEILLDAFIEENEQFPKLEDGEQRLIKEQLRLMQEYRIILEKRINIEEKRM